MLLHPIHHLFRFTLVLMTSATWLDAQTLITEFNTTTFTGNGDGISTQDEADFTFDHTVEQLDTFVAGTSGLYTVSALADQSFVRRNATNPDQSSVWYSRSGSTYTAEHGATIDSLLLGNTFRGGSDNTFVNGWGASAGNIERVDFVFSQGVTATESLAFAVLERGGSTIHDRFQIAAITGWDATTNQVTAYSDVTGMGSLWGTSNPEGNFNYQIFRYNTGDDSADSYANQSGGGQGMGGVIFDMDDFNVTAGSTVYGYSVFGYDVSWDGDTSNLIDWTNSAYFPTNTNDTNGGIDLAAVNGIAFSAVPEPATWATTMLALVIGLHTTRRRRFRRP